MEDLIRKQTNWIKAVFGCLAAIVAAIIILSIIIVPKVNRTIDEVEQSLTKISSMVDDADEALKNINSIDFDDLNQSIRDLATISNAIAKIFGGGN